MGGVRTQAAPSQKSILRLYCRAFQPEFALGLLISGRCDVASGTEGFELVKMAQNSGMRCYWGALHDIPGAIAGAASELAWQRPAELRQHQVDGLGVTCNSLAVRGTVTSRRDRNSSSRAGSLELLRVLVVTRPIARGRE